MSVPTLSFREWRESKARNKDRLVSPVTPEPPKALPPPAVQEASSARQAEIDARLNRFFDTCRLTPDGRGWIAPGVSYAVIKQILRRDR